MQETLCLAHIYAVAGMAGVNHALNAAHDYGVGGQFESIVVRLGRRTSSGHPIAFQAKATINWHLANDHIVYDLEAKTYNDLVSRDDSAITMVLILLCMPTDQTEWHLTSSDATTIRNFCYWYISKKGPLTTNLSTQRIYIPSTNVLTADSLKELLTAEKVRRQTQWS